MREHLQMERTKWCAPTCSRASEFTTNSSKQKLFTPECGCRSEKHTREFIVASAITNNTDFLSTSLIYTENTRAITPALPAASKTLSGCQSTERAVDLMGFLRSFGTHQLLPSSKRQIAMVLITIGQGWETDGGVGRTQPRWKHQTCSRTVSSGRRWRHD